MRAIDRFNDKWEPTTETGCWLWNATPASVYGLFWLNGKNEHAHRASWTLHNGDIPYKAWVLHRCDVAGCVNPDHLYLGDRAKNTEDAVNRGRMQRGNDHKLSHDGSRRNANNGNGILSDYFCIKIKANSTKSNKQELADIYEVNLSTIYKAIHKADALLKALEEE